MKVVLSVMIIGGTIMFDGGGGDRWSHVECFHLSLGHSITLVIEE